MKSNIFFALALILICSMFWACENETSEPKKDDDPVVTCNDTIGNITFNNKIAALITTYCGSNSNACHRSGSSSSSISLDDYDDVKEAVTDNNLMATIKHENGYSAMPKGAAKLSDCQIAVFQKWVNTGMVEN